MASAQMARIDTNFVDQFGVKIYIRDRSSPLTTVIIRGHLNPTSPDLPVCLRTASCELLSDCLVTFYFDQLNLSTRQLQFKQLNVSSHEVEMNGSTRPVAARSFHFQQIVDHYPVWESGGFVQFRSPLTPRNFSFTIRATRWSSATYDSTLHVTKFQSLNIVLKSLSSSDCFDEPELMIVPPIHNSTEMANLAWVIRLSDSSTGSDDGAYIISARTGEMTYFQTTIFQY